MGKVAGLALGMTFVAIPNWATEDQGRRFVANGSVGREKG